jgi:hypothetical protein
MNSNSSRTTWDQDDQQPGPAPAPDHEKTTLIDCLCFWTGCLYQTESIARWRAHCSQHLEGKQLPMVIECSFCHDFTTTTAGTSSAWNQTLDHVLQSHRTKSQRSVVRRSTNSFRSLLDMLPMVGLSRMSKFDNFNLTGMGGGAFPSFDDSVNDILLRSAGVAPFVHGVTRPYQASGINNK